MTPDQDQTKQRVERLLERYEFSAPPEVSYLTASENQIYLIDDHHSNRRYVIRINSGRLAYHNAEQIHSEMMWLDALGTDTDIIVPKVLAKRLTDIMRTKPPTMGSLSSIRSYHSRPSSVRL